MPAEPPRRRHRLLIEIGADSPEAARHALDSIAWALEEKGDRLAAESIVSGGPDAGWSLIGEFRPEVTHETYFEASQAWLAERRARGEA